VEASHRNERASPEEVPKARSAAAGAAASVLERAARAEANAAARDARYAADALLAARVSIDAIGGHGKQDEMRS
jgi:hypothetical protein